MVIATLAVVLFVPAHGQEFGLPSATPESVSFSTERHAQHLSRALVHQALVDPSR